MFVVGDLTHYKDVGSTDHTLVDSLDWDTLDKLFSSASGGKYGELFDYDTYCGGSIDAYFTTASQYHYN